ncbi:molybdopterin molybdenumtransferase MoeA [Pelagivirga sediminicola]|uniref:Molybdopterin molybdenumtransferase n=1 Tax=Pelagivirga sediminicola TaxID=2170575 RepID=A0A2T7G302_9RHOB|nr:gephyrin-like molybdotransferase Glp [Pelagivirga sediminicola]PVA08774.1 molybdopterin molybdenumtransferase MoeA [Pelagivirga sediminicola]
MDGSSVKIGCDCDHLAAHQTLLSHTEAVEVALAQVQPITQTEKVGLSAAHGRITATRIVAAGAMPSFDNSAMDGFALRLDDLSGRCCLPVVGTVAAGDAPRDLPAGTALRIYTGAPLPRGASAVVMVEACIDKGHKVHIETPPAPGANIRRAGSDQRAGQMLLPAGTQLAPHHIGLLAANGVRDVTVTRRPRVALFSTGDEVTDGDCLPGRIKDANRPMLSALLARDGAEVHDLGILPDDAAATEAAFRALGNAYDLILTTGAVSMGGKDHVRAALCAAGGRIEAWRVALKPGKPVMFGSLNDAAVTGLPGNPMAVHVGYYMFLQPQLARLTGAAPQPFAEAPARADFDWQRKSGRAEVFPVCLIGHDTDGLPVLRRLGQGVSATLLPLAQADGMAIVAADCAGVAPGDMLHWHPFNTFGGCA